MTAPSTAAHSAARTGLVVEGLVRQRGAFTLGPVSCALGRGRALGLLGANGAGKTTFLACAAGQSRAHQGRVAWNGHAIARGNWRQRQYVSYVRDVPALYEELTVGQTLRFVSRLHPRWRADWAAELLGVFQLDQAQRVGALSRGMKAKLGLLLAVSHHVELLLLDEVTAGVDADTRDDIQRYLRRLVQERHVSVVISSHIFEDIEHVSDDVLILRQGQPVFAGQLSQAQQASVRDLYFAFRGAP